MTSKRIAIIGGGPGGLMTCYLLEQRTPGPLDITIFEAGHRLGGKIVTPQFETAPVAYEAGAAELYDYTQLGPDPLRELIAELGLTTRPMAGGTVVLDDKFLKTDADILRELGDTTWKALARFNRKARAAISPAEYYESDWKADNEDPLSRHTFRALLARIPDPAARRYVEVAVHSDLATEPHRTSAMYGLQNYLMDTPDYMRLYTIDGGIERLPQELAKRLRGHVLLHQPVVRVERTANGQYRVWSRNSGEVVADDFDFVVVALPNNWIPTVEWGGEELTAAMYHHHRHYDYPAHYLRVSILFEKPFWRDRIADSYFMLDAFGGCCVYDESSRNGADSHGVLGWLLAGDAALNLSNLTDAELVEAVLDSLPRSLRHGREWFLEGQVHRWANTVNGLPGGYPMKEPDSRHLPEPVHHPRLFVVGDYLFDSTINGVLDSADVVAEWILEEIAAPPVPPLTNGLANGCRTGWTPIPTPTLERTEP
jgi:protoporphyrinogen oxidase